MPAGKGIPLSEPRSPYTIPKAARDWGGIKSVRDYVVQAGPLRTFETLYDGRFEKFRAVADYHTIEINARAGTVRRVMAAIKRADDTVREVLFVSDFFKALARGHRTLFGIRDVSQGNAYKLGGRLKDQTRVKWAEGFYGSSEDDLIVAELRDFAGDFDLIKGFCPPTAGEMFFYLSSAPFDVFEIYWQRACRDSLKAREDRFRRDVVGLAHQSKIALHQDPNGSFTVVVHPQGTDVSEVENAITAAGEKSGMSITFAPGLFS